MLKFFSLIFLLIIFTSCSPIWYSAESIRAVVVDKSTGEPLSDVVVLAYWKLETGLEGGINGGVIKAIETVTNNKGEFEIPEWDNVKPPKSFKGVLKSESPGILLFKPGYDPTWKQNSGFSGFSFFYSYSRSEWDGQKIQLFPKGQVKLSDVAYSSFGRLVGSSVWVNDEEPCLWKENPIMLFLVRNDLENMTSEQYSKILRHLSGKEPKESCENIDNYLMRIENELQIK